MNSRLTLILAASISCLVAFPARGADAPAVKPAAAPAAVQKPKRVDPVLPTPTAADVAYGKHPKQVLSFWKAESDKPTPLLFYIHGGGWMAG
ncbi:MAG: alpha/beta hydrolase, partial [Chthoniobacteraceae bacterium]